MPFHNPNMIFQPMTEEMRKPFTYSQWLKDIKESSSRSNMEWWHQEGHPLRNSFLLDNKDFEMWTAYDPVLSNKIPDFYSIDNHLVLDFNLEQSKKY